jgi:hypothetical protein
VNYCLFDSVNYCLFDSVNYYYLVCDILFFSIDTLWWEIVLWFSIQFFVILVLECFLKDVVKWIRRRVYGEQVDEPDLLNRCVYCVLRIMLIIFSSSSVVFYTVFLFEFSERFCSRFWIDSNVKLSRFRGCCWHQLSAVVRTCYKRARENECECF